MPATMPVVPAAPQSSSSRMVCGQVSPLPGGEASTSMMRPNSSGSRKPTPARPTLASASMMARRRSGLSRPRTRPYMAIKLIWLPGMYLDCFPPPPSPCGPRPIGDSAEKHTPSGGFPMTQTSTPQTSRDRLEACLARIADPSGEGSRAVLRTYTEQARAAADAADARARLGMSLGPLDGRIVSIQDLFDVTGETTTAGSKILRDRPPATADAPAIARLRAAGAVIVAKTNMTEFAFSGVGINPHYGTPGNPADRSRIPGGSSSGGAVAVADGMSEITIGSDTGGSTRIPAALCGIVGWKPSQYRVPTEGGFPLSYALDSIGPMAKSVADCALADAVMAGEEPVALQPAPVAGLRLGVP